MTPSKRAPGPPDGSEFPAVPRLLNGLGPGRTCLLICLLGACSSGGGGGSAVYGPVGTLLEKPGTGEPFFLDAHEGGRASRLQLSELVWGRLVNVHDVDARGITNPEPVFRDFVINENIQTDGLNYVLETNPITQATRLVVRRTRGEADAGSGTFESLVRSAEDRLSPVTPKHDDGTSVGPFSFVARNACLVLRFNDVLADSPADEEDLFETVKVLTGYPPATPFSPRLRFDRNHGGIVNGGFHSTRVLIDTTTSRTEASESPLSVPLNSLGLPASSTVLPGPDVSVRIPTRASPGDGQFVLLRTLRGATLSEEENGPLDETVPTREIVRAVRSGNDRDPNNGFLLDLNAPEVVGSWGAVVSRVRIDADGSAGVDFLLDVGFTTPCAERLEPGGVLAVGGLLVEVTARTAAPDLDGLVPDVSVRSLERNPIGSVAALVGVGSYLSTYDPAVNVPLACWMNFLPPPGAPPRTKVAPGTQAQVRFSEPMLPSALEPFDALTMVRGIVSGAPIGAMDVVVGTVSGSADLQDFTFTPLLPLAHFQGDVDTYHLRIEGVSDLAGNSLLHPLAPIEFTLDPAAPAERNSGVVLRFSERDEIEPVDAQSTALDDLRGQVFYDPDRGLIKPRPVVFSAHPIDRLNPVPSIMTPFAPGVQTPLSRLGSKLQVVWRYCDAGWSIFDETKHDIDVVGLNWAPVGGRVSRDYFDQFEIRLAHSAFLPEEVLNVGRSPKYPLSGLPLGPAPFANNVLQDPRSPQVVVHERQLGYSVEPLAIFVSGSGTKMIPFPFNQTGNQAGAGGPLRTFTWRDTTVQAVGGPNGVGVPLDIESGTPLELVEDHGIVYHPGQVRSVGLPLLMEFRCFPSASGVGLNPFDISLAANSAPAPNFRAFSTGGLDTAGDPISVNPDLELAPRGGFNPSSSPPGKRTRTGDNALYIGQLDTVFRVSRAHTVWIDSGADSPRYLDPILVPSLEDQPRGTDVIVEFRGASGFGPDATAGPRPRNYDAASIGPYGNVLDRTERPPRVLQVDYWPERQDERWRESLSAIDGARYFQLRISFVNDIDAGLNPELSALGVAYLDE